MKRKQKGREHMATIIIPAYQPDETLLKLAGQLWEAGDEMIVVDDGSGESYQSVFDRLEDICIVLHHRENRGKGAAIKTALCYIRREMWDCDVVGIMDADGQHLPTDMQKLTTYAHTHRNTMVLGCRSIAQMPFRSRIGNAVTREVFHLLSGVRVKDTQTGLRAFDAQLIPQLLAVEGQRYEYETNVLMTLAKKKIPIEEVEIHTIYHDKENSCSHFHVLRDSFRIYRNMLKFSLSSASSFLVDYLLFAGFITILPHTAGMVLLANVMARLLSAFYNYSMNCRFIFHTRRKLSSGMQYFLLAAGILLMNNVILLVYTGLGLPVYFAKILTECTLFLISFNVQSKLIFKRNVAV